MTGSIPMVDLKAAHAEVAAEVAEGFERILANTAFIGGEEVAAFEREYAAFNGLTHCIGVANGTDALELALRGVGVGPGDEAVVQANTFIATAEAVSRTGADVVFVDSDPDTYLVDVDALVAAVGPRTKAVVPVHLYGQLAPVDEIRTRLDASGYSHVRIVEDAAQCQGATRHGHAAGSPALTGPGAVASTSFYPGKNLGAYGDAGAVTTDDGAVATTVRTLGSHGGLAKYVHDLIGVNSRLDALQAVVLRAKLRRLAGWNDARRAAAARYNDLLAGHPRIALPKTLDGNVPVWHLYVVRVGEPGDDGSLRDAVVGKLNAEGIGAGVHYPTALHRTGAYASLGLGSGAFPTAEDSAARILSLPLDPHITPDRQERVAAALLTALG